jgi:hypothetical protein
MKQAHDFPCFGVNARQVGPFLQVALPASEREIIQARRPSTLFGNDVLNMERPAKERLR